MTCCSLQTEEDQPLSAPLNEIKQLHNAGGHGAGLTVLAVNASSVKIYA